MALRLLLNPAVHAGRDQSASAKINAACCVILKCVILDTVHVPR